MSLKTVTTIAAASLVAKVNASEKPIWVYLGSYAKGPEQGITLCEFHPSSGKLEKKKVFGGIANPSFLEIHPSKKFLFAVNEIGSYEGKEAGSVTAFSINPDTGGISEIDRLSTKGGAPCHLSIDAKGKTLFVANYSGGSVISFRIRKDGGLKERTFVQHEGSSVDPRRQTGPHGHSIKPDPSGKRVYAADLGLDKVLVYKVGKGGNLKPSDPPFANTQPGGGPRHIDFHPSGKFAYVNLEMTSKVSVFVHDAKTGALKEIQTVSTLPENFEPHNSTAEVLVHPSGKFVYCSNRGHDSIAVFSIDGNSGKLTFVEREPTGGKTPRNFCIDPSGAFLLAANQSSNNVVVFKIDGKTGALAPTGSSIETPKAVCVRFLVRD